MSNLTARVLAVIWMLVFAGALVQLAMGVLWLYFLAAIISTSFPAALRLRQNEFRDVGIGSAVICIAVVIFAALQFVELSTVTRIEYEKLCFFAVFGVTLWYITSYLDSRTLAIKTYALRVFSLFCWPLVVFFGYENLIAWGGPTRS